MFVKIYYVMVGFFQITMVFTNSDASNEIIVVHDYNSSIVLIRHEGFIVTIDFFDYRL